MRSCLIVCYGYFGDHLFANSIAEHLIKENQYDTVDYVVGFPQVIPFFERNPFVNKVIINEVSSSPSVPNNIGHYDRVFQLGPINRKVPPAVEMQLMCGVKNPSSRFYVNTNPDLDKLVQSEYNTEDKIVAIMNGWEEKTFLYTREQYARGVNIHPVGYGGSRRNTKYIIEQIESRYPTITVGTTGVTQFSVEHDGPSLDLTASLLKYCEVFIGAEGGLANLAYAVGTNTILTSDFVHQLYGPNGILQKLEQPRLGPSYYEYDTGYHIDLDPYLSDEEVAQNMLNILQVKLQ